MALPSPLRQYTYPYESLPFWVQARTPQGPGTFRARLSYDDEIFSISIENVTHRELVDGWLLGYICTKLEDICRNIHRCDIFITWLVDVAIIGASNYNGQSLFCATDVSVSYDDPSASKTFNYYDLNTAALAVGFGSYVQEIESFDFIVIPNNSPVPYFLQTNVAGNRCLAIRDHVVFGRLFTAVRTDIADFGPITDVHPPAEEPYDDDDPFPDGFVDHVDPPPDLANIAIPEPAPENVANPDLSPEELAQAAIENEEAAAARRREQAAADEVDNASVPVAMNRVTRISTQTTVGGPGSILEPVFKHGRLTCRVDISDSIKVSLYITGVSESFPIEVQDCQYLNNGITPQGTFIDFSLMMIPKVIKSDDPGVADVITKIPLHNATISLDEFHSTCQIYAQSFRSSTRQFLTNSLQHADAIFSLERQARIITFLDSLHNRPTLDGTNNVTITLTEAQFGSLLLLR